MGDYCEVCGERHATYGVLCDECWKVTPDGMLERAEKAEARIAHIRSLLGYPSCTICIMADEDCEECPVAAKEGK